MGHETGCGGPDNPQLLLGQDTSSDPGAGSGSDSGSDSGSGSGSANISWINVS